jgi:hypothetical protein
MPMDHVPRIAPLASPYEAEIATALAKWMPPGSAWEPLKLFRGRREFTKTGSDLAVTLLTEMSSRRCDEKKKGPYPL